MVKATDFYFIPGFRNKYAINKNGEVFSYYTDKYLNPTITDKGLKVTLLRNKKRVSKMVHRLVALMFLDNPNEYPQVSFRDRNLNNPKLSNLRWTPYSNNYKMATSRKSYKAHTTKSQREAIIHLVTVEKISVQKLAQAFGVKVQTIYNMVERSKQKAKPTK